MKALIAEKPSVARDIARILGATQIKDGYQEGNGYMVTWAFGHLIQLAMPEEYGFKGFKRENLPMFPDFKLVPGGKQTKDGYKPDPGYLKQLKVIKEVFNQCDEIIVATDAGREGELIFRYIYDYLHCNKPFVRLWISSLTDSAIREGMNNLRPGSEYNNLYKAALGRSRADWLVGMNASQALSIAAGRGSYSLGRVQSPTLAMICSRYLENKNFKPVPYYQIKAEISGPNDKITVFSDDKWDNKDTASNILERIRYQMEMKVESVEKKETTQDPPLLYDLTSLQKDANSKLNLSAQQSLDIVQKLYEKKFLTYPRTGSRYISDDIFEIIPERIRSLKLYGNLRDKAEQLVGKTLNKRSVDASKVTDHHALIITENIPQELSKEERAVYEMVATRMLEAFSQKCYKDMLTIKMNLSDIGFTLKGSVITSPGWRAIRNEKEESDGEALMGMNFKEGDLIPVLGVELAEKETKPKPLHTESSLLGAMETAGKEIEDEELRASIKDCGIGTPATRASIIEALLNRGYIERQKKHIIPTDKGLSVYETVKDKKISDVAMTAQWEADLTKIQEGSLIFENFINGINGFVREITSELLAIKIESNNTEGFKCPKCKEANMRIFPKSVQCTDKGCGYFVYKTIAGKELSDKQIADLFTKGKTGLIKGFKGKSGKDFDAHVVLKEDLTTGFEFDNKKDKK